MRHARGRRRRRRPAVARRRRAHRLPRRRAHARRLRRSGRRGCSATASSPRTMGARAAAPVGRLHVEHRPRRGCAVSTPTSARASSSPAPWRAVTGYDPRARSARARGARAARRAPRRRRSPHETYIQTVEYDPELRRWYVRFGCDGRDATTIYFDLHQRTLRYEVYFLPDPPDEPPRALRVPAAAQPHDVRRALLDRPRRRHVPRRPRRARAPHGRRARPHHRRALRAHRAWFQPVVRLAYRLAARAPSAQVDAEPRQLWLTVTCARSRGATHRQVPAPRARGAGRPVPFGEVRGRSERSSGPPALGTGARCGRACARRARARACATATLASRRCDARAPRRRSHGRGARRRARSTPAGTPEALAVAEVDAERRRVLEERSPACGSVPSPAWAVADAEVVVVAVKPGDVRRGAREASHERSADERARPVDRGRGDDRPRSRPRCRASPWCARCRTRRALVGRAAAAIAAGTHADRRDLDARRAGARRGRDRRARARGRSSTRSPASRARGRRTCSCVAEAMIEAGVLVGPAAATADALVRQTLLGRAHAARRRRRDPESLRAAVTSPGGTTAAGLQVLEAHGVRAALLDAVARRDPPLRASWVRRDPPTARLGDRRSLDDLRRARRPARPRRTTPAEPSTARSWPSARRLRRAARLGPDEVSAMSAGSLDGACRRAPRAPDLGRVDREEVEAAVDVTSGARTTVPTRMRSIPSTRSMASRRVRARDRRGRRRRGHVAFATGRPASLLRRTRALAAALDDAGARVVDLGGVRPVPRLDAAVVDRPRRGAHRRREPPRRRRARTRPTSGCSPSPAPTSSSPTARFAGVGIAAGLEVVAFADLDAVGLGGRRMRRGGRCGSSRSTSSGRPGRTTPSWTLLTASLEPCRRPDEQGQLARRARPSSRGSPEAMDPSPGPSATLDNIAPPDGLRSPTCKAGERGEPVAQSFAKARFLTVQEVADMMRVSSMTVYR